MPKITIPVSLLPLTGQQNKLVIPGKTLIDVIINIVEQYPGIKDYFLDRNDHLATFVNFYINDKDARYLQHENTVMNDTDEVHIIVAMSGG